ncbi:uncharacterized protein PRCAT00005646001 [Priceomyces carsonii]|uniref:uncharacterized protein n=1 Tax=Priceomyces carsonii TaxID=28549 RepID=UPI002ED95864|nr:unnamed protein product [Priceomyces carsonii]
MVRLKQRYILFDILHFPSLERPNQRDDFLNFSTSETNAILSLHQSSPNTINPKLLTKLIRSVIQEHFGDNGAGKAGMQMTIKYFSNTTSTGIIRCSRSSFHIVRAALSLINMIENDEIMVRCLHVSGTIKKCEERCISRNEKLMSLLSKSDYADASLLERFSEIQVLRSLGDTEYDS